MRLANRPPCCVIILPESGKEAVPIRLSIKIILIFSVMMLIGLMLLSSYAANTTVNGANAYTEMRFRTMGSAILRDLEQELSMMELTLQELTGNTTFMAALNQVVRDDSDDLKMAHAAEKIVLQQLNESPLVDTYYQFSFFTRDGISLTSSSDAESSLFFRSERAKTLISSLPWLDEADQTADYISLPASGDPFSVNPGDEVYGIAKAVKYRGNPIGYISIVNHISDLKRTLVYLDEPDICVEAVFSNGNVLFRSHEVSWEWPSDLPVNVFSVQQTKTDGSSRNVFRTQLEKNGLNLYISQDSSVVEAGRQGLRSMMLRRTLLILLPAVLMIILVSVGLTSSIRKLAKKMRHTTTANVLTNNEENIRNLLMPVTSPFDREINGLEQVFDQLIIRLRSSASNELALREGTLQAQLNALQTQINPHFIYNTLNIISAKSMESGNFDVIEICDQFAGMLRYSTDTRSRTATMAEEIENVRNYLMLSKARYEDNLDFIIDVPENLNAVTVPKLTLQPLVENAMTHGFDGQNTLRKLSVTGHIRDQYLVLEIRDNGTGFSDEMLTSLQERIREIEEGKVAIEESGGHIGLINTCLRLHYYSHGKMRVMIRNDHGAVITLYMPFGEKENPA